MKGHCTSLVSILVLLAGICTAPAGAFADQPPKGDAVRATAGLNDASALQKLADEYADQANTARLRSSISVPSS